MNLDKTLGRLGEMRDRVYRLVADLVKARTENPPGDVTPAVEVIQEFLAEHGYGYRVMEPAPGRKNIVAEKGEGERSLMFNGHTDVVPAGDRSGWAYDPFAAVVVDGYLYGRGASDMKGGLAALLAAFAALPDDVGGRLVLAAVADEEVGGRLGAGWLVENGIVADAVVIGEPSGFEKMIIGEKGPLWLRITFKGEPGHGSLGGFHGTNALRKACDALRRITGLEGMAGRLPSDIMPIVEESNRFLARKMGWREPRNVVGVLTVNPGVLRGGVKTNVVPDRAVLEVDMRVPPGLTTEEVEERVRSLLGNGDYEIEVIERGEPGYTPPGEELARVVAKAAAEETGVVPSPLIMWASSDARHYRARGIPTILYGPGEERGIHGYNERIRLEDVFTAARVYARLAHLYFEGLG